MANTPKFEQESGHKDRSRQAFTTLFGLTAIGLVGVVGHAHGSGVSGEWPGRLSIVLLVAIGSLSVGGFFGFIFGMPRAAAQANSPERKDPNANDDKKDPN